MSEKKMLRLSIILFASKQLFFSIGSKSYLQFCMSIHRVLCGGCSKFNMVGGILMTFSVSLGINYFLFLSVRPDPEFIS